MEFPRIVRPPDDLARPVVVSSPHSGQTIPDLLRARYAVSVEDLWRDGDLYVDELYEGVEASGATLITTPFSRFVIDLNRLPDDLSPAAVAGEVERTEPGYYGVRGLIWAVTTHGVPIYRSPLSVEDKEIRLRDYYRPYHLHLGQELERLRRRFGFVILIDAHSMPSRAARLHRDRGAQRPDVIPGDLRGQSCAAWLTQTTAAFFLGEGHSVVLNDPYAGGAIARSYGAPAAGVHAIQVELNRALYMDESTLERGPRFATTRSLATRFVERVCEMTTDADVGASLTPSDPGPNGSGPVDL